MDDYQGAASTAQHDALSTTVSRVVDELRRRGVQTQAAAIDVISAWECAGLTSGEIATVLWQFADPHQRANRHGLPTNPLAPQWDPDYHPQRCQDSESAG